MVFIELGIIKFVKLEKSTGCDIEELQIYAELQKIFR